MFIIHVFLVPKMLNLFVVVNAYTLVFCSPVLIRFVKGSKPGNQSGFDIDEADLVELEEFHEVIVASAIFGMVSHCNSFCFTFFLWTWFFLWLIIFIFLFHF